MYEVIRRFQERFDGGHDYNAGDVYPREGFAPPSGRAEALCKGGVSEMNANGAAFLKPASKMPTARKKPAESR